MLLNPAFSVLRRNADPIDGFKTLQDIANKQNELLYRPVYKLHNLYIVRDGCCQGTHYATCQYYYIKEQAVRFKLIVNSFFN